MKILAENKSILQEAICFINSIDVQENKKEKSLQLFNDLQKDNRLSLKTKSEVLAKLKRIYKNS